MKTITMKCIYAMAIILSLMICSCSDDFTYYNGEIPEGEGDLSATLTFTPASGVNLANTRTNGDAIRNINSLCVLVYTTSGDLVRTYSFSGNEIPNNDIDVDDYYGKGEDDAAAQGHPDEPHAAETKTPQVKVQLQGLPYGRYKIYAVANMDDLSTSTKTFKDADGKDVEIKEAIQTEEGLRNINLTWNTNVPENNQMFGYFTSGNTLGKKFSDPAPVLIFTQNNMSIHSWLNRVVSKLTVQFDASGLNQGVEIYVKSVTVYDIPKTCLLGNENKPDGKSEFLNRPIKPYPKPDQPSIAIENLEKNTRFEYNSGGIVGDPNNTDKNPTGTEITDGFKLVNSIREPEPKGAHEPNAASLFFFENNQGDFNGDPRYDKRQQKSGDDGVGTPIRNDKDEAGKETDFKDKVPYGTYVEVEAYYISTNPGKVGQGSIKYRFMLGKNISYNYDVQRNYHFKLTLGFKGWANQPDWHIDYEQPQPGIEVQPVFRVSYLYNQVSYLPIRILETSGATIKRIDVEIIENNWAPYDPETESVPDSVADEVVPNVENSKIYAFRWNKAAYENAPYKKVGGGQEPYYGFLALHLPPESRQSEVIKDDYSLSSNMALEAYYKVHKEGERSFDAQELEIKDYDELGDDSYKVIPVYEELEGTNEEDKQRPKENQKTLMLPVWTRAKTLIRESGFSGNNPYDGYERKAKLKITATFSNSDEPYTKEVDVFQVKRLVNPKGVWRAADRSEPFHVTLLEAKSGNDMSGFRAFTSEGEWTAFIDGQTNKTAGFYITPNGDTNGYQDKDGTIHGYTGSEIHFDINFDKVTVGNNDTEAKCAIVKVLYHGNQCLHKILVRKGYDQPVDMGGKTWSSFSLYQATERGQNTNVYDAVLTKNPLMLGSMFRRGRMNKGIFVTNNMKEKGGVGPFEAPGNYKFIIGEKDDNGEWKREDWTTIGYVNQREEVNGKYPDMGDYYVKDDKGKTQHYRVPTYDDFAALTADAEFGFGVVYGSSAYAPAETAEDAYGLIDPYNEGLFDDPRGMRGVIAYKKDTGDQIFFPMGKYGTGRRNNFIMEGNNAGVLRYGDVNYLLTIGRGNNLYRPVPYNLMVQSGNIYWIDKYTEAARGGCYGWDINYFNFDFNPYTANNYRDALPVKFILIGEVSAP